ncbi:hypothetical protein PI125_g19700 [Phytophthora idaei]|nr:hypothetical protein PI125_g19700 [Phytophthora idaei]
MSSISSHESSIRSKKKLWPLMQYVFTSRPQYGQHGLGGLDRRLERRQLAERHQEAPEQKAQLVPVVAGHENVHDVAHALVVAAQLVRLPVRVKSVLSAPVPA